MFNLQAPLCFNISNNFLSAGKFKATNYRVLWNKSERLSISFFFELSYDFKMNRPFKFKKNLHLKVKFMKNF